MADNKNKNTNNTTTEVVEVDPRRRAVLVTVITERSKQRQAEEYLIDKDYIERKAHEMYAKDCSKKVRAVVSAKGNAGKHISYLPPLGYMKAPEDKEKWIVEHIGASIVKEIFALCLKGYGPTQIARLPGKVQVVVVQITK